MNYSKTREVIVEIERTRVITRTRRYAAFCRECSRQTEFVTDLEAAALADTTLNDIHTSLDQVILHAGYLQSGLRVVCLNSLLGNVV